MLEAYPSTNHHYPLLVYYAMRDHMYWVGEKEEARRLAARTKDIGAQAKSDMLQSYAECANISLDDEKDVKEKHLTVHQRSAYPMRTEKNVTAP